MGKNLIPSERIENKILLLREQKVMLDRDLAALYEVETRVLNQAVKRNSDRFPVDFMFELTREEIMRISQIVISSADLKACESDGSRTGNGRMRLEERTGTDLLNRIDALKLELKDHPHRNEIIAYFVND